MQESLDHLRSWIGRSRTADDRIDPWHVAAMHATLDRAGDPPGPGDALPPGWHWLFFREAEPARALASDGHPARGAFLPPVPLDRRMWAGGRLSWQAPIPVGADARRTSTVLDVTAKQGRSGPLVFVTVGHEIAVDGTAVATEEHDIVYRDADLAARPAAGTPPPATDPWQQSLVPDPVLLFRYSALTFNGHRIHYDADYTRDVEGYPGLIVHGPLTATLLMGLVAEGAGAPPATFDFRARAPLFCGEALSLSGGPDGNGGFAVAAYGPEGRVVMTAEGKLQG